MHCSTREIPALNFPRDEIIEIIPAAYQNEAKRIHIPGLDPGLLPNSPDGMKLLAAGGSVAANSRPESLPASGQLTPLASALADTPERLPEKVINLSKEMVADKVDDED